MKKNSAFTLRSGNKPSFAKLSGVQKSSTTENVAKMKKSPAKNLGDDKKKKEKPDRRQVMNKLYKECAAGDRMACITLKYMQGRKLTQEEKDYANDPKNIKKKDSASKMKKSPAKKNGGNTKSHSDPSKRTVYISDNKYGLKTRGTVETQKDMILSSKQKNKNYSLNERGDVVVKTSIVDKRGNVVRTKTKTYKKGTAGYRRMFKKADKIADKSGA